MTLAAPDFALTRFVFQRLLAGLYFVAFLLAVNQSLPLCGANGLQPVRLFLKRITFWDAPFGLFGPRNIRIAAGLVMAVFQLTPLHANHGKKYMGMRIGRPLSAPAFPP